MTLLIPPPVLDPRRALEIDEILRAVAREAEGGADLMARDLGPGMYGFGVVELRDEAGDLLRADPFCNMITTYGDEYYCKRAIAGISPASPSQPSALATGMKLGTGNTAAAKSGAGSTLVTYITGSNNPFDSGYPQAAAVVGTNAGWNAIYKTTWAAGDVVNSGIVEVVICTDAAADEASLSTEVVSRAVITLVNKGSSDALAVTWSHKFLGAAS